MKSRVTKTPTPGPVDSASILVWLNTPIIRACVLNLIAQIALGTPMAAQARRNSHLALLDRQNAIALRASRDSVASKGTDSPCRSEGTQKVKNDVQPNRG